MQRLWRATLLVATAICLVQLGGAIGYHAGQATGWVALGIAILSALLTLWRPTWALPVFVAVWPILMGVPRILDALPLLHQSWPAPPSFAWTTGLLLGIVLAQRNVDRSAPIPRAGLFLTAFGALVLVNGVSAGLGIVLNLRDALPFTSRYVARSLIDLLGLGPFDDWTPLAAWLPWVVALALAIVAKSCMDPNALRRRLIGGLVIGGVVQALLALVQLGMSGEPLDRQARAAFGTLPDIHAIGSYLLVCFAACIAAGPTRFRRRALWWLTSSILMIGLIASGSRNSWLAGAALIGVGLAGGFAIVDRTPRLKRAMKIVVLAVALVGASAIAYFATHHGPGDATWTELDAALTYRLSAFWTAGRIVADHPLAGCGLGRLFGLTAYPRYSGGTAFADIAPENAHDFFLQQLAEAGPLALALWCVICVALIVRCWDDDRSSRACAMAAMALLLTNLLAHSLLIPPFLALFAILLAALDAGPRLRGAGWLLLAPMLSLALAGIQLTQPAPSLGLHPRLIGLNDWETLPDGSAFRWTRRATGPRPVHVQSRWLVWKIKCPHSYVSPENPLPITITFIPPVRRPARFTLTDCNTWYHLAVEMPAATPPELTWNFDTNNALVPNRVSWSADPRPLGVMMMSGGPMGLGEIPTDLPDWQRAPLSAR